jgi:hypothetical protein
LTRLRCESLLGVGNGDEERPAIGLLRCGERQRSPAKYTVTLGRYDIELVRLPLRVISSEREGTGASCAIDASNGQPAPMFRGYSPPWVVSEEADRWQPYD